MSEIRVITAPTDRWGELFTLQRAAFVDEAALYGTPDVPPLTEGPVEFQARLDASTAVAAADSGRLVGAVFAIVRGSHLEIERLMVAPDCRRRGIATALMTEIERRLVAGGHKRARLVVGELAAGNRSLYERLGYTTVERELIFGDVAVLIMEKQFESPD